MAWLSWARTPRRTDGGADKSRPGQGLAGRPAPADRMTPPAYDMSPDRQEQARAEIAELIERLRPGALDAGSREVLNNLINARTDAQLAELDAARDERKAVVDNSVALAAEQVARCADRIGARRYLRGIDRPDAHRVRPTTPTSGRRRAHRVDARTDRSVRRRVATGVCRWIPKRAG
jgi:hypothetical protein